MEVFKWNPQIDLDIEYNQRTKEAQFGDGYEQSQEDGLNSFYRTFKNFRFTDREDGEVKEVFDFFMRHKFTKPFKLDIRGYSGTFKFTQPFNKREKGGMIVELSVGLKEVFV